MTKLLVLAFAVISLTVGASAQRLGVSMSKTDSAVLAPPNLDQCANGARNTPEVSCTGMNWQNGSLNRNNSQWVEGEYVPYRVVADLPVGTMGTVTIEYDTTENGYHTLDWLGSYNASTEPPN